MTDREKLVCFSYGKNHPLDAFPGTAEGGLISRMLKLKAFDCRMCASKANCPDYEDPATSPGLVSKACSEFKPHVPGPSDADPNIMELCFRNGEQHMKDKIKHNLQLISKDMPCVTISQVIKILEDLQ